MNNDLNFSTTNNYYNYFINNGFELKNCLETKNIFNNKSQVHLCKNDPLLMIYLSILRNRETKDIDKFRFSCQKILTLIIQQMLLYNCIEKYNSNKVNDNNNGITFTGVLNYSPFDSEYDSIISDRGIYK